jgi:membrane-associated phospholipid phosphatase
MPAGGDCLRLRIEGTLLAAAIALPASELGAQVPSDSAFGWHPGWRAEVTAAALGFALAQDRRTDEFARSHRTRGLDRLARDIDPLGKAHYVVPALVTSFALSELDKKHTLANRILRVGIAYVSADVTESLLKPIVGRHRPDSTEHPFRFHPFKNDEQWHSFPSAHTTHAFAIAEAVSLETSSPWARDVLFAGAGLVGAQRIYLGAHWTSDVIATAALAVVTSKIGDIMARKYVK